MSAEFSNLILAQRVYQSASQVMQAAGSLADTLLASTKSR
jgi:flagellar hook protein FlgE